MILSDGMIVAAVESGRIVIDPFDPTRVQPASIDVTLSDSFRVMHKLEGKIDPRTALSDHLMPPRVIQKGRSFIMRRGAFALASTVEIIGLPDDLVARIDGKSSLGRWGLLVHATAGYIDPGFYGQITLELSNVATMPIELWPGMAIAQISFMQLASPALRPYGSPGLHSKYQGQRGATASAYWRNDE